MIQHQIVQSPARLGLTNPTSPSLPVQNPTPPKFPTPQPPQQQHHQHHHPSTTATTSSALLSLLQPLPRAQSLLLQMASLATKLFELSPNRPHWLSAFCGTLPTFLPSQSQSLPPLDPTPSSNKEIISLFTSLQTQLFESVAELQEILDLQDAKQRISAEIKSKDSALLNFANKLKEAERVVDILVDDYTDYRCIKRAKLDDSNTTVASHLKLSDILSYAHRISYTTFAPPGQGALRGALPPAPQEEQMRASQLYNFSHLDVGLPKAVETKEKTIEAIIEPPPETENLAAIQGLLPPNIMIPAGWKPGMPVVLPTDLPVPPPGWKPGDPVSLDTIPLPRAVEQKLPPIAPQGLHKPPEPIQVRHVDLDIPDQDDDSSDYSSDVESSDDED